MGLRCRRWLASDRSPAAVGNASLFRILSRTRPSMLEVLRGITETSHGCRLSLWKVGNNTNRVSSIRSGADVSGCRLEAEMRRRWWPECSSLRKRYLHWLASFLFTATARRRIPPFSTNTKNAISLTFLPRFSPSTCSLNFLASIFSLTRTVSLNPLHKRIDCIL